MTDEKIDTFFQKLKIKIKKWYEWRRYKFNQYFEKKDYEAIIRHKYGTGTVYTQKMQEYQDILKLADHFMRDKIKTGVVYDNLDALCPLYVGYVPDDWLDRVNEKIKETKERNKC